MSKTMKQEITVQQAKDALNALQLGQETAISFEEAMMVLENTSTGDLQTLNADFWGVEGLQPGEYSFMATGIGKTSITDKSTGEVKEVEVVYLTDAQRRNYICALTVLVNSVKKTDQYPAFIKVVYKGMKGPRGRQYADLQVFGFRG